MLIRTYKATDHEACLAIFRSNTPRYFDPEEMLCKTGLMAKMQAGKVTPATWPSIFMWPKKMEKSLVARAFIFLKKRSGQIWFGEWLKISCTNRELVKPFLNT